VTGARCTVRNVTRILAQEPGPTPEAHGARRCGDHEDPGLGRALLSELRAALTEYDLSSELRQELAALAVRRQPDDPALWVFVAFGGRYFSWNNAENQHPVFDVKGAAHRIATLFPSAAAPESGS
jgi:hypothetical protein